MDNPVTTAAPDPSRQSSKRLGEVAINKEAFELDLKINEGYQGYSAELLRLSLLMIAGLGAVWLKLYVPAAEVTPAQRTSALFALAFTSTALSAGASLLHRYAAADSLAYHLTALRRRSRNRPSSSKSPSDEELAKRQEIKRDRRFLWSGTLLRISIVLLFAGLVFFCLSMGSLMFR
ncbi:hypothetical protein [Terriglobus roseus]|uniref:DUF202 domain-containing protein n=1 Tax=Terriglobus roseus TaxID=392734 RepID=A0A1H4NT74_9BACT|nr:hypothetical protein [Terriglobus roseus]SEB98364.1 hypothetical protein SAMN05443244_2347 [Terriglobus roseus]